MSQFLISATIMFLSTFVIGGLFPMAMRIAQVFPQTYLVSPILDTDLLLLGTDRPLEINVAAFEEGLARPEVKVDLADKRVENLRVFHEKAWPSHAVHCGV